MSQIPPLPAGSSDPARRLERTEAERDEALRQALIAEQQRDMARELALQFEREAEELRRVFTGLLNDELAGHATALKSLAATFEGRLADREPSLAQLASMMVQSTDAMLAAIRDAVTQVRPAEHAAAGVPDGLRALISDWRLRKPAMRFELLMEPSDDAEFGLASPELETAACRIVAEAISNAVGHARAGMVVVSARRSAALLTLQISDDGRGLPLRNMAEGPGLRTMRALAERCRGRLSIATGESGGAEVLVELPWS
jgi:glucose-6-phosphate-specific signal transduction histidine kinase